MQAHGQSAMGTNAGSTIAAHVAESTTRVPDSIPSATFKDGFFPHTYTTLSYQENAEPDTQKLVQNLSPMEFAAMGQMMHAVPDKLRSELKMERPHTWSNNLDPTVTGRGKWKTGDSMGRKTKIPYLPYTKTTNNMKMYRGATQNARGNKQLLGQSTMREVITGKNDIPKPEGMNRLKTADNVEIIRGLVGKVINFAGGLASASLATHFGTLATITSAIGSDAGFQKLLKQGYDVSGVQDLLKNHVRANWPAWAQIFIGDVSHS
jgi:hypothetical protein